MNYKLRSRGYSLILLVSLHILIVSSAQDKNGFPFKGVHPEVLSAYDAAKHPSFTCLDNSKSIPFTAVNDDYCDCTDGSDEPGTSACSNGKFYCQNTNHIPSSISSSRVNDGYCDPECCDGTDEFNGLIKCPNICDHVGVQHREKLEQAARMLEAGLKRKAEYRKQAQENKVKDEMKMKQIETKLSGLESTLQGLKTEEAQAEEKERLAKEQEQSLGRLSPSNLANQIRRLQDHVNTVDRIVTEFQNYTHSESDRDTFFSNYFQAKSTLSAEDLNEVGSSSFHEPESTHELGWADRLKFKVYEVLNIKVAPLDVAKKELEAVRQSISDTEESKRKLESEKEELAKKANIDYNNELAYLHLYGKCFTLSTNEYTYQLCPFGNSEQRAHSDSFGTNMGTWSKWESYGWLYDQGLHCWNGPARNVKVTLECGSDDKLISVSEPNKCEYAMRFQTPAACDEKKKTGLAHEEL